MADPSITCAECGGPVAQVGRGRPRKFCSDKCKARTSNRRTNRSLLPLGQVHTVQCHHCGRDFQAKDRRRALCSQSCKTAAYLKRKTAGEAKVGPRTAKCDGCGTQFDTVRPEARWCSKACANRHWGGVRARQRGQRSSARYTDREIFERDGWRCHICKKKVRTDVDRRHPDGATIDHIIPISRGGTDEPANVATAHWKCNRDKRAGSANDQLALI